MEDRIGGAVNERNSDTFGRFQRAGPQYWGGFIKLLSQVSHVDLMAISNPVEVGILVTLSFKDTTSVRSFGNPICNLTWKGHDLPA